MIITLAGRRIDEKESEEKRFPLEMKDVVYQRILAFFREHNVSVLVSSAACGVDLLAQKAARELGIERHIILPFEREKFRKTSVTDRPGDWGKLFDEICDEAEADGNLIVLKDQTDEAKAYSAVTIAILEYTENLPSNKEKVLAVAVWEGKAKDDSDETASFIRQSKMKNIEVKVISTVNINYL